jgi:hypothetical protein
VELVRTHQAIGDPIRPVEHLPDLGDTELGDDATRLREAGESIRGFRASLARRRTGLLRSPRARRASRRPFSRSELLLDLFVGDQLAGFGLTEALLDLGQEAEPLDRVLERRIVGKVAQSFEGQLLFGLRGHGAQRSNVDSTGPA